MSQANTYNQTDVQGILDSLHYLEKEAKRIGLYEVSRSIARAMQEILIWQQESEGIASNIR